MFGQLCNARLEACNGDEEDELKLINCDMAAERIVEDKEDKNEGIVSLDDGDEDEDE